MRWGTAGTRSILLLSSLIIRGASPVIYRLAQLVLPEGHKWKMRLLLSEGKQGRSVPLRFHQNKHQLMAIQSHPKADTDGTSLFSICDHFFIDLFSSRRQQRNVLFIYIFAGGGSANVLSHNSPAIHRQREQKFHDLLIVPFYSELLLTLCRTNIHFMLG